MTIVVKPGTEKLVSGFIGKYINSPEQRLVLGITALGIQPVIDYYNKKADDETRAVSVARTIGKIIAGTIAGVTVRYASIAVAKQFSRFIISENGKYISNIKRKSNRDVLLPKFKKEYYENMTKDEFWDEYNNTIKTIGTAIATFTMIFTNFLIDAPLTKIITKALTDKVRKKIKTNEYSGGVNANS